MSNAARCPPLAWQAALWLAYVSLVVLRKKHLDWALHGMPGLLKVQYRMSVFGGSGPVQQASICSEAALAGNGQLVVKRSERGSGRLSGVQPATHMARRWQVGVRAVRAAMRTRSGGRSRHWRAARLQQCHCVEARAPFQYAGSTPSTDISISREPASVRREARRTEAIVAEGTQVTVEPVQRVWHAFIVIILVVSDLQALATWR